MSNFPTYFVVMRDHGKLGREAIVDPEHTRRKVIDLIASGELDNVIFVHEIVDGLAVDVTDEILAEALSNSDDELDADYGRSAFAEHNTLNRAQQGI